jgi:succinate dehydrogenase / fumarate reductase cytochrome b subunit
VHQSRPRNLNLFTFHFPLPAIVSILHRISGVVLFLLIPLALWALNVSLTQDGFDTLKIWMQTVYVKIFFWLMLIPFCYHLVAGIRHLLTDIHIGSSLKAARMGAKIVFLAFFILVILTGIWLW